MKLPTTLEPHPSESTETRKPETHSAPPRNSYANLDLDHQPPSKNYWWVWLLIFAGIGYGCYRLYAFETAKGAAVSSHKGMMTKPRSIPVVAEAAWRGDMPVFLQGLGTVTAFNTVTVKSRVDGQLISVNFKEGQFVHKGDVLAEIDARPFQVALDQAEGNLKKDQAALKDAQANYLRDQELFKDQIIAKQQLDTQLATADQFRGAIEADQAAIASAKLNLTFTKITAPISGRIGLRQVDAGNIVHAADTTGIATITQVQPISVLFTIPEDQLPPVLKKLHQGATMRAEAYDRAMTTKLADGTLLTVDNEIDTTTGTSRLKAVFPNTNFALFPNQFVNVRLQLDTLHGATIIPAVAIQRGPGGETFVYLVRDDNTVTVRPVKAGRSEANNVSIDDGLQPGDRVVVDGAEKLEEGMKVTLHQPSSTAAAHKRGQEE
ncbi:MAG TPA: MdtA/MuxA family multidrug efflux RND transporter periplasmic adaptor subunit [Bryobacteraceae bacterium]|nr:MdtA/MuxA family multidrug efflux RND transporter periplasmic adaptor subunit [Bryobacteraceae bacterium]